MHQLTQALLAVSPSSAERDNCAWVGAIHSAVERAPARHRAHLSSIPGPAAAYPRVAAGASERAVSDRRLQKLGDRDVTSSAASSRSVAYLRASHHIVTISNPGEERDASARPPRSSRCASRGLNLRPVHTRTPALVHVREEPRWRSELPRAHRVRWARLCRLRRHASRSHPTPHAAPLKWGRAVAVRCRAPGAPNTSSGGTPCIGLRARAREVGCGANRAR